MPLRANFSAGQHANRFYRSAKVNERQFKRVLWSFVTEQPVAEASKAIGLSANSINAIYGKLRRFFTQLGTFTDIYEGRDPRDGTSKGEDMEEFEYRLLTFHLQRLRDKRRMKATSMDEIDCHWCESHWRFHYTVMTDGRPSNAIHRMMFSHLLEQLRCCGPIGQMPRDMEAGRRLIREQEAQRLLWLERNAPEFRDSSARLALQKVRMRNA